MYEHTQRTFLVVGILLTAVAVQVVSIAMSGGRAMSPGTQAAMIGVMFVMVGATIVFSRLTIRVDDGMLTWYFGGGVLRKSESVSDIAGIEETRTRWWDGWGVRLTTRGRLYNVAGWKAVLITMQDGRTFLLGTDEPEALVHAVRSRLSSNAHE